MKALRILFIITFWNTLSCNAQKSNDSCFISMKDSLVSIDEGKVIDLTKLNCIKWDELVLIPPSFSRSFVEEYAKINLPKDVDYSWVTDGEGKGWWVLFLDKKNVISYFFLNRVDVDFTKLSSSLNQIDVVLLPKSKAKFITFATGDIFFDSKEKVIDVKLKN
ncbi:MAG: hypothetical protein ABWZ25_17555 [Chitinophagaceae bacterium]